MNYTYQDKNDVITCQLIDREYNSQYWSESEACVLDIIRTYILAKTKEAHLLDLGCGMGRLFCEFASVVGHITAAEPDKDRHRSAVYEASKVPNCAIEVYHGDISVLPPDETYDIIIMSHVVQHITCDMTKQLIHDVAGRLNNEGLLVILTTHTAEVSDIFTCETLQEGQRRVEVVDKEGFNTAFNREGVLPVRIFAENTITSLCEENNLRPILTYCFHYKGHDSASQDVAANHIHETTSARDVLYIFGKSSAGDMI